MKSKMRLMLISGIMAVALLLAGPGAGSLEASRCDMPTGFIGSRNMLQSPMMIEIMMLHTAPQGDAGMRHANVITTEACLP